MAALEIFLPDCRFDNDELIFDSHHWKEKSEKNKIDINGVTLSFDLCLSNAESGHVVAVQKLKRDAAERINQFALLSFFAKENPHVRIVLVKAGKFGWDLASQLDKFSGILVRHVSISGVDPLPPEKFRLSAPEKKKRQKIEIVRDILQTAQDNSYGITELVHKCNLNFEFAMFIIDNLISRKLLAIDRVNGKRVIQVTDDGIHYLVKLSNIELWSQ